MKKRPTRNKHISSFHFYCLVHNEDIYVLNNRLKSIGNAEENDALPNPSTHYLLPKRVDVHHIIYEIQDLLKLQIPEKTKIKGMFHSDLNNFLFYLIFKTSKTSKLGRVI